MALYAVALKSGLSHEEAAEIADDGAKDLDSEDGKQFAGDWDESKHPRGSDGKFGGGSGSGSAAAGEKSGGGAGSDSSAAGAESGSDSDGDSDGDESTEDLDFTPAGEGGGEASFWDGTLGKVVSGVWSAVNAAPKMAQAIVAETGASEGVAKAALAVAMVGDYSLPGVPAGSLAVSVLATVANFRAPLRAASKAISGLLKSRRESRSDKAALDDLKARGDRPAAKAAAAARKQRQRQHATEGKRKIVYYDAAKDPQDPGMYKILSVPCFARVSKGDHGADDDWVADADALRRFCAAANKRARNVGHYRALHLGHQDLRPGITDERPLIGFMENYKVAETTWGPVIHVDFWGVDERSLRRFERGHYPYISIECDDEEILSAAILQSRPPHFPFPNIRVRRRAGATALHAARLSDAAAAARRQFRKEFTMDKEKNPPLPFEDDDDRKQYDDDVIDDEDEETQQHNGEQGMPVGQEQPPAWAQQILELLQQIAGGAQPQQPAVPAQAGASPDTTRPLEPASGTQYGKSRRAAQYARLHPEDRKLIEESRKATAARDAAAVLESIRAEARLSGATLEEIATLESMHRESPAAAKQFASHLRTRPRVTSTGKPVKLHVIDKPTDAIADAIKAFEAAEGVRAKAAHRAEAEKAMTDWRDTVSSESERVVRAFAIAGYADDPVRFIRHRLEQFHSSAKNRQFAG